MRGRIQRALSGFYYVKCADGQLYTCKARGKFRKDGVSPLVGDDVEFCEVPGGEGRIDELLPRKNSIRCKLCEHLTVRLHGVSLLLNNCGWLFCKSSRNAVHQQESA